MKRIAVIGHFGLGKNLLNGQTIKTKILTEALQDKLGRENIESVDTHGGIKKLIKLFFKMPAVLKRNADIIMLPAHNGVLIFTPMLSFFNKFTRKNLHYVVIGGWLPEYLDKHKFVAKLLRNNFRGIYVETRGMQEKLRQRFFKNVVVMPNCKHLDIVKEPVEYNVESYRFCTFSRVMKEKGIEDAIKAVTQINEQAGRVVCTLDIFGQIDSDYKSAFEEMQKSFPEYVNYCGLVEFSKSTEVLKDYYALLFPTFYSGEGFAGTVIDAFAAGIPVIASDWRYNAEIVENMKTGIVYPCRDVKKLMETMCILMKDDNLRTRMGMNCILEAESYLPERVVQIIIKAFE